MKILKTLLISFKQLILTCLKSEEISIYHHELYNICKPFTNKHNFSEGYTYE